MFGVGVGSIKVVYSTDVLLLLTERGGLRGAAEAAAETSSVPEAETKDAAGTSEAAAAEGRAAQDTSDTGTKSRNGNALPYGRMQGWTASEDQRNWGHE